MKILIVSQYYPPEVGAAATRWSEYGQILTQMGHDVTILTELPNYPSGVIAAGFPKYWFHKDAVIPGKPCVIRVPVWANPRKTTIQRLGFFTTFMFSAILRALFLPRYDIIVCSSPPLFVGLVATFLRPFKRGKYVLDLRDIWPESAFVLGEIKSEKMLRFGQFLERLVYDSVDVFFFAVPGFKEYFKNHHPRHLGKPMLDLMNGVSSSFLHNLDASQETEDAQFTVLFSGNIGLAQNLETLLDAARLLSAESVLIKIIGDGAKKEDLEDQAQTLGLANVQFVASMTREDLIGEILAASVCLVPLIDSPLFLNAIPSKLLEYMAAGKPVIVGIRGEVETLVKTSGCGICITPESAVDLADAIRAYKSDPTRRKAEGSSGARFIRKGFTKEAMIERVLSEILNS